MVENDHSQYSHFRLNQIVLEIQGWAVPLHLYAKYNEQTRKLNYIMQGPQPIYIVLNGEGPFPSKTGTTMIGAFDELRFEPGEVDVSRAAWYLIADGLMDYERSCIPKLWNETNYLLNCTDK